MGFGASKNQVPGTETTTILAAAVNSVIAASDTSITDLPENVFLEIMQHLPMRDRCIARGVCQNWNQMLTGFSLWRHVDLRPHHLDLNTMWSLVRTHCSPHLLTFRIQGYEHTESCRRTDDAPSDAMLEQLSARSPNLQLLHFNWCRMSNISFESLPSSITCLEIVHSYWQRQWMKDKQMHLPGLKRLTLDQTVQVNDADMQDVSVWKNLKYLSLEECVLVGISGIRTISENLLELEFLNISYILIDDLALIFIANNLKKLKGLNIAMNLEVTEKGATSILEGLPVLFNLNISFCRQINLTKLKPLFVSKLPMRIVECSVTLSEEMKQAWKTGFPEKFVLTV